MKPLTRDGQQLYVLVSAADKSVLRRNVFSNVLGGPPVTDADSVYLALAQDDVPPYDPALQTVTLVETANDQTGQYEITFLVQDKTKAEMLAAVDRAKLEQVQKQAPPQPFTESAVIIQAAIIRETKIALTPEEQVHADAVTALAQKLLANQVKADADKAIVEAGGKPDTKTGWEDVAVAAAALAISVP